MVERRAQRRGNGDGLSVLQRDREIPCVVPSYLTIATGRGVAAERDVLAAVSALIESRGNAIDRDRLEISGRHLLVLDVGRTPQPGRNVLADDVNARPGDVNQDRLGGVRGRVDRLVIFGLPAVIRFLSTVPTQAFIAVFALIGLGILVGALYSFVPPVLDFLRSIRM